VSATGSPPERLLIVGASSGIGAATAARMAARGSRIAVAGRRVDALEGLAAQLGEGCVRVACDVRDEASIRAAVAQAVDQLGGLDAVVYTPADLRLVHIEESTADGWRVSFETNVVGAALVAGASAPALRASEGRMVFLSSDVVDFPRSGLGLYGSTKRALEGLCVQLRLEIPEVRYTVLTSGPSRPTSLGRVEDYPKFAVLEQRWLEEGIRYRGEADVGDVAEVLELVLTSNARIDHLRVEPPGGGPQ